MHPGMRLWILLLGTSTLLSAAGPTVQDLASAVRAKARMLEGSAAMKDAFRSLTAKFQLQPATLSYGDFSVARLLFEATRDAGFWNLHWRITNQPPNSDAIWKQWKSAYAVSPITPTAIAECDELSALYAFLTQRAGVRGVGLFWPTGNHTFAVWVLRQPPEAVRIVVPTTQIFLDETDYFGTRKFDPWRQKNIYEYSRRDVADSFELPKPLFDFLLQQMDKYADASDVTLQLIRYWREAVFLRSMTADAARKEALRVRRNRGSLRPEDAAAFENFARDLEPRR